MPELKSSQYSIKFAWGCLIIALIVINTNYFLSKYRNSISKKPISRSLEDTHDYKNILDLQNAFIRNTKKIKPSVVSVNKVKELVEKSSWFEPHSPRPWYYDIKKWFTQNLNSRKYSVENVGSGVILDSNGYILTNYHVVENLDRVMVKLSDGKEYFA